MKGFIEVTEISLERVSHRDSLGFENTEILKQEYPQNIVISNIKRVVPEGYRGNNRVSLILDEIYNGENVVIMVKETYEEIKKKIEQAQGENEVKAYIYEGHPIRRGENK